MVILTTDYVERKCLQLHASKSLSKRYKKNQLWKLTHLQMNNMFITAIGNLAAYKNLRVIYLQDNTISKIENLHFAVNLTHLYLQHNKIAKLENLECLRNLQKLHLGHNCISVVEGLENLQNLVELRLESQDLPSGETLCFDPRTSYTLSTCLKVLNISKNKLTTLKSIKKFHHLEALEAKDNRIEDMDDLTDTVCTLVSLKSLSLNGNPINKMFRYRENLIANSDTLGTLHFNKFCTTEELTVYNQIFPLPVNLDGRIVSDVCHQFMRKFKQEKHLRQTKKKPNLTLSDDITSSLNLPPAFKRSISRAIFQHPGPILSISVTPAIEMIRPHVYPAWKSTLNNLKGNHVTPRPFWRCANLGKKPYVAHTTTNAKSIVLPLLKSNT